MAEKLSGAQKDKKGRGERALRFLRDFNAFVGGVALVGAAVVTAPVAAAGLAGYGAFNIAQAAGYEVIRQGVKRRSRNAGAKSKDVIR